MSIRICQDDNTIQILTSVGGVDAYLDQPVFVDGPVCGAQVERIADETRIRMDQVETDGLFVLAHSNLNVRQTDNVLEAVVGDSTDFDHQNPSFQQEM